MGTYPPPNPTSICFKAFKCHRACPHFWAWSPLCRWKLLRVSPLQRFRGCSLSLSSFFLSSFFPLKQMFISGEKLRYYANMKKEHSKVFFPLRVFANIKQFQKVKTSSFQHINTYAELKCLWLINCTFKPLKLTEGSCIHAIVIYHYHYKYKLNTPCITYSSIIELSYNISSWTT